MIVGPVGGSRNGLFIGQLQGVDASHNFVHIATHAGGVIERQHEFVFWVDDKYGANGEGETLLVGISGIEHAKGGADGAVGVANDGEFDLLGVGLEVRHDSLSLFTFIIMYDSHTHLPQCGFHNAPPRP
jgi:hypothetical protein